MSDGYVLFLAGGRWQVPWISYLKGKGHRIILVDPNDEPPCKQYANVYCRLDVNESEAIKQFVKDGDYKIDLVTSEQTDVTALPVALLSQHFGTPHIHPQIVEVFADKYLAKTHALKIDAKRVPRFSKVPSAEDLGVFLSDLGSRCIVKPSNSQSSRGISILSPGADKAEIAEAYETARQFGFQSYVVAEELVHGTEVTLEGMVHDGKHRILAASRKKHFRPGIASELAYPLLTDEALWSELSNFHNRLVEETGIKTGVTHTEYFIDENTGQFWLIEMACRGGGSLIPSHLTPWVSGFEVYDLLYAQLFKKPVSSSLMDHQLLNRAAVLHFFEFPPGQVTSIDGLQDCKKINGVLIIDLEFNVGDIIKPANDDRGRQGFVIILAKDDEEARAILAEVYQTLNVVCE